MVSFEIESSGDRIIECLMQYEFTTVIAAYR